MIMMLKIMIIIILIMILMIMKIFLTCHHSASGRFIINNFLYVGEISYLTNMMLKIMMMIIILMIMKIFFTCHHSGRCSSSHFFRRRTSERRRCEACSPEKPLLSTSLCVHLKKEFALKFIRFFIC